MQIDLDPTKHSTLIEVIKTPKKLFFGVFAIWAVVVIGFATALGFGWPAFALAGFSVVIGIGWVTAYPEFFMRRS